MKDILKSLSVIVVIGLVVLGISKYAPTKEEASPIYYDYGRIGYYRVQSFSLKQSPSRNLVDPKCLEWGNRDYRLVTDDGDVIVPSFIAVFAGQEGLPECIFDYVRLLSYDSQDGPALYLDIGLTYVAHAEGLGVYKFDVRNNKLTHLPVISNYFDGSSEYTEIFSDDRTGVAIKNSGVYVLDITKDTASLIYTLSKEESVVQFLTLEEEGGYLPSYGSIQFFRYGDTLFVPIYSPTMTESGARVSYDDEGNMASFKVESPDWKNGDHVLFKHLRTLELRIPGR